MPMNCRRAVQFTGASKEGPRSLILVPDCRGNEPSSHEAARVLSIAHAPMVAPTGRCTHQCEPRRLEQSEAFGLPEWRFIVCAGWPFYYANAVLAERIRGETDHADRVNTPRLGRSTSPPSSSDDGVEQAIWTIAKPSWR